MLVLALSRRDGALIGFAAVALVVAGLLAWTSGRGAGNPDFPEGHLFVCADCGLATVLSDDELFNLKVQARNSDSLDAGRVVCSACGSNNTNPGVRCPNCGACFARPNGRPVCPKCKQPFPSPFKND